jgi:hypothetical protein
MKLFPRGLFDRAQKIADAEARLSAIRECIDENRRTAREAWESRVAADREAEEIRAAEWQEWLARSARLQERR